MSYYHPFYVLFPLSLIDLMLPCAGNEFIQCQDESTRKVLREKIIDALRSGERPGASALLSKLIHGNNPLSADDFHGVLKYCARSPDPVV